MSVPALPTVPSVGACVSATPDVRLPGAEAADTCGTLNLCQPPQVPALAVNEEVSHAAHVAKAERGRPHLGGEHEGVAVLRQTSEIHVPVQVKDLTAFVSGEGDALAVHRYEACRARERVNL